MIKAIIFDCGGVIVKNPAQDFVDYFSGVMKVSQSDFERCFSRYLDDFEKGLTTEDVFWQNICRDLKIHPPSIPSLWQKAVARLIREDEETVNIIARLKRNGYRTGLLTNTEKPTAEYLKKLPFFQMIDSAVFSCFEGVTKPDKKIFLLASERLKTKPYECLFVDDKQKYVEASRAAGLQAVLFTDIKNLIRDFRLLRLNT
jgi:epoxide hydrolase-like predicted phosphatase